MRYPYQLYPKESSTSHLVCSGSKLQINPVPRTKNGEKCWTCAPVGEGRSLGMDTGHPREANSGNPTGFLSHGPRWYSLSSNGMTGQRAMFWMLPLLWSFMDWPNSFFQASAWYIVVRYQDFFVARFLGYIRYIDLPQVFV